MISAKKGRARYVAGGHGHAEAGSFVFADGDKLLVRHPGYSGHPKSAEYEKATSHSTICPIVGGEIKYDGTARVAGLPPNTDVDIVNERNTGDFKYTNTAFELNARAWLEKDIWGTIAFVSGSSDLRFGYVYSTVLSAGTGKVKYGDCNRRFLMVNDSYLIVRDEITRISPDLQYAVSLIQGNNGDQSENSWSEGTRYTMCLDCPASPFDVTWKTNEGDPVLRVNTDALGGIVTQYSGLDRGVHDNANTRDVAYHAYLKTACSFNENNYGQILSILESDPNASTRSSVTTNLTNRRSPPFDDYLLYKIDGRGKTYGRFDVVFSQAQAGSQSLSVPEIPSSITTDAKFLVMSFSSDYADVNSVRIFASNASYVNYGGYTFTPVETGDAQTSFNVSVSPPSAPTLLSPANGATAISTSPTLSWNASSGATSYTVQWATNSNFTGASSATTSSISYPLPGLSNNTTYYWRVSASNGSAPSPYSSPWSFTTSSKLVISQLYGGGGNIGATLKNDFIELLNRTDQAVSLSGPNGASWSVQYAAQGSAQWQVIPLSGSIPAKRYYLVKLGSGGGGSVDLPTPDVSSTVKLNATTGKAALVASTTPLSGTNPLPSNYIIDLLGYGSSIECYEGAAPAPTLNNTTAAIRLLDGYTDTDNNGADFTTGSSDPHNSSTPTPLSPKLSSPADNVANQPTTITLSWNASGGASQYSVQWATNPEFTIGRNSTTVSSTSHALSGIAGATRYYWQVKSVAGFGEGEYSAARSFTTAAERGSVIISQVYGGGGNSGAQYKNDFIELFNRSDLTIDVTGWSVQYAASGSANWAVTSLSGSIGPRKYYLIQLASGGATGATLPTADKTGTTNMSATSGKVALVPTIIALTQACPTSTNVYDLVGYGNSVDCSEGGAPVPNLSNTTAAARLDGGMKDTDNNGADFLVQAPDPHNTQMPALPVLAYPGDNTTNQPTTLTLGWNASAAASSYRVQLSLSASYSSTVVDDPTLTVTSKQVGPLLSNSAHYWRVNASNSYGTTPWTGSRQFRTVDQACQAPQQNLFAGQNGSALISNLVTQYKTTSVLSYDRARDTLFARIYKFGDSLRCVYSGYTIYLTLGADPTTDAYNKGVSTEHTWPQSKGSVGQAKSDMHHLYPVKNNVNSSRSNLPFDAILANLVTSWFRNTEVLTSSPPVNEQGQFSKTQASVRFEPRNVHKGNVARAMFYFHTMYKDLADSYDSTFFRNQKEILLQWHYQDPVDCDEYNRTMLIASYQGGKVNPFILDTTLVRRAYFEGYGTPPAVPAAPTASSATNVTSNSFTANWNAVSNATSYRLDVATSPNFTGFVNGYQDLTVGNVTSQTVTGLSASTAYYYRVRAVNSAGTSVSSDSATVTTLVAPPTAPSSPTLVSPADGAINVSTSPTLSWNVPNSLTVSHLQVARDSIFTLLVVNDSTLTELFKSIGSLSYTTTYYWKVRAKNGSGWGEFSGRWSFTTVPCTITITASAGAGGSISPSGSVSVNCGSSQTFTITPNTCYRIVNVLVNGVSQGAITSYTFNNVASNQTISASFELIPYTITVSAGAGGSISPGTTTVSCGGNQTFTITPSACYRIADVVVNGVSQGAIASYTFTNVQSNQSISATFAVNAYTITASAGTGGSISPSGSVSVNCGASQTFTITPNTCYRIVNVLVNGVSQGAIISYTFSNVTSNQTISASFEAIPYTITASAGTGGSISPSGSVSVACGGNQTFNISPNAGYNIANVVVDNISLGVVWQYTFSNVTASHTITASFSGCEPLGPPQWVTASSNLPWKIELDWDFLVGSCSLAGFKIYRRGPGGVGWSLLATHDAIWYWHYDDYVDPEEYYEYYITTIDNQGRESGPSVIVGGFAWWN